MIRLARAARHPFSQNVAALAGSMAALGVATLWVARVGGPVAVGDYALLRVLPWLLAVIVSGGLAGAISFFLAGPTRDDPRVRSTVVAIAAVSAVAGALLWIVASPLVHRIFFKDVAGGLIVLVAARVALRLFVITGKATAQGTGDLSGSNRTILFEELLFLPAYGLLLALNVRDLAAEFGTDSASMTRTVQRLERAGYVRRVPDPDDGRATRVEPTPASLALRAQVEEIWTRLEQLTAGDLTPAQRTAALRTLRRLVQRRVSQLGYRIQPGTLFQEPFQRFGRTLVCRPKNRVPTAVSFCLQIRSRSENKFHHFQLIFTDCVE